MTIVNRFKRLHAIGSRITAIETLLVKISNSINTDSSIQVSPSPKTSNSNTNNNESLKVH